MGMKAFAALSRWTSVGLLVGYSVCASAGLVEIKFATNTIGLPPGSTSASEQAFLNALAANGISPNDFGSVTGRFFYESTTLGNVNPDTRIYNGAIESLSFSIANWFSQSLTSIGNSGDILVSNDITAQNDVDRIVARVACSPSVGATGSSCQSQPYNFSYSVFDPNTSVTWVLDEFELFIEENGSGNPLSSVGLPSQVEWESTDWVTRRVDLRFNPNCSDGAAAGCANIVERATVSFLAVPEPGSAALAGLALLTLGAMRRRI